MILRLVVADSSQSPAVAESVELAADGTISGWRSVSDGGAGWFAGRLPPAELAELQALITAAEAAPPPAPAPPDSAQEVLELAATGPVSIAGRTDGLAEAARALLDRLTDFPQAAVAVTHVPPNTARLTHRGTDPVRLDLSTVAIRATAWRGYYEPAGDWSGAAEGPAEVEAGPGWTSDLPFEAASGSGDTVVQLAVDFAIVSGTTRIPVRARLTPAIPPPT
jgi:hypothetical protein